MSDLDKKDKGVLAWFARNHVAANLLMGLIIVGGLLSMRRATIEIFPDTSVDMVTVTVPYLGASPSEVEDGVILRVEEAIAGIEGIKRIYATAVEGSGTVRAELEEYADNSKVLDDIKAAVDRIITFPEETEKPIITEVTIRYPVLNIVIYGDTTEKVLKELAERVRDDLTAMDNISQVDVTGIRDYEISIEVSEETLRRYGLTFDEVARAVGQSSLDLPGGSIETRGGEVLIRTTGQRYVGREFEEIVVLTRPDGTEIKLREIANVIDGFEESDIFTRFDGKRAVMLNVSRVGKQGLLDIAGTVKDYAAEQKKVLPGGISMAIWSDTSDLLKSRVDLLRKNAFFGLILVFLCLALFLDLKLAFWTTMGIPISFMGAFWLMPVFDVSINMISLFAFILSLGLVVDDAIVVGENIFAYRQEGMNGIDAAIKGAREMLWPVTMAVLTTVVAFMPMLFLTGIMGRFIRVVPIIVISVLLFSLLEALCILPAHLSIGGKVRKDKKPGPIARVQNYVRQKLDHFVNNTFSSLVKRAVAFRYVTFASGVTILLFVLGFVLSGRLKFVMFPQIDADNVMATLEMPQGTPVEQTERVVERIEEAALAVQRNIDADRPADKPSIFKHIASSIGTQPETQRGPDVTESMSGSHLAEVNIELLEGEKRDVPSSEIEKRWRQQVGQIPGISSLVFTSALMTVGKPIDVELSHDNFDTLLVVVERLKEILGDFEGVKDITDSFEPGKMELKLELTEQGRTTGLTLAELAGQVRQGFYGEEVQRIQRGRNDIRVMVRYPLSQRKSLSDLETMRIRLSDGTEVPFETVARVTQGRGYAAIDRAERTRVVHVRADVDNNVANANEINGTIFNKILPRLESEYPGLMFRFAGEQEEQQETTDSLKSSAFIALFAIFALLAVQFRSYAQPVIIMTAIPFGLVGAVIGHILMGFDLSMLSIFGIVALTGVVVNDSLILIDLINRQRAPDIKMIDAVRDSAVRRFRPIMLTTLTTFFGLVPMLLEQSLQARFLIPMAVSLAFGIVFATSITLLLVPSLYMILEDVKRFFLKEVPEALPMPGSDEK